MIRIPTLQKYVLREISSAFVFCFTVFFAAGFIAGFLPLLQKGIEKGLAVTLILFQALISALPTTFVTILPLSIMIAVLLGLGRMAADNEISAIKSAGISVSNLLPPVIVFGLLGFGMALICTLWLIPRGISEGKQLMLGAAAKQIDSVLEERVFFDSLSNIIIYVDQIDSGTRLLHRIFIKDTTQPEGPRTILAKMGKIELDSDQKNMILILKDGTIIVEDRQGDSTRSLIFEKHELKFPVTRAFSDESKSLEESSIKEIRRRIKESADGQITAPDKEHYDFYVRAQIMGRIMITQRIVHPLACVCLTLLAFPLGLLNLGKSRLNNVSVGLMIIFLYYAFTLAVERAARSGLASPEIVMPLTPLLFSAVAFYLIRCVRLERVPDPTRFLRKLPNLFRGPQK